MNKVKSSSINIKFGLTIVKIFVSIVCVFAVIISAVYVMFAPHISAFLYNQSEIAVGQHIIQFLKNSQEIQYLIQRKKKIDASTPKIFMDLKSLSEEVMKKFDHQESILAAMANISSKQSRIPLLEERLEDYHAKKISWIHAEREYITQFKKIKQIEYKVSDLSLRSHDLFSLVHIPESIDSGEWMNNSQQARVLVERAKEDIQTAIEENILTKEYANYLLDDLSYVDSISQLNLRALSREITWKQWERDLKAITEKQQENPIDVYMERVKAWREAVIKPLEDKINELYEKKEIAYFEMIYTGEAAPIFADAITSFLVERGIIKLPSIEAKELINGILLPSEIELLTNMMNDPDVLFVRDAINKYVTNNNDVCIKSEALKKGEHGNILSGLDFFDQTYYRSKFTPIDKGVVNKNTNYIRVLFIDVPDRVFTVHVENIGSNRCVTAFFSDEDEKKNVKLLYQQYKRYLLDPKYSL